MEQGERGETDRERVSYREREREEVNTKLN